MANVNSIEKNSLNLIEHRLRGHPCVHTFEELNFGHSSLRAIAPYALKIRQNAVVPIQQFFKYAAVVAAVDEDCFACIIFDLVNNSDDLVAYAGHFVTPKNLLYDPKTREPVVSDLLLLDSNQNYAHLLFFGTANANLLLYPDYFLQYRNSLPYQELVMKTQEMLAKTMQQQQQSKVVSNSDPSSSQAISLLREPLTTSFYIETSLPISTTSVKRIIQKIQPMGTVKRLYGELGSFHAQTYASSHSKAIEDATNFNAVDEVTGRTTFYSAYEEPGLMSFYFTSFLLGSLKGRHVVGVLVADSFFIMATNRIYNLSSETPVSVDCLDGTEVMKKIHLPSSLPLELVVTMLELRQILRHPFIFLDEIEAITKSFGFDGYDEKPANLCLTFIRQLGPKTMMERMQRTWVQQMLDIHYTQSFQNSLCEYGESPVDSENPSLFSLNIVRLWIKELLRAIHCDKRPKDDCKLSSFFRMTIVEFIQSYISLFGLSPESCFTCHHLGVDGIVTTVCETAIAAKDIGKHVDTQHTSQIWTQGQFTPFVLSLSSKFVSLTNQMDVTPLENCKSTVDDFRGISYMEVLRKIDGTASSSPPPTPPPLPITDVPGQNDKTKKKSKKRKRLSIEEKIIFRVMKERTSLSFTNSSFVDGNKQKKRSKRFSRSLCCCVPNCNL